MRDGSYTGAAGLLAAKLSAQFLIEDVATELVELKAKCAPRTSLDDEPIRMIDHLGCTGGTLFAKCIASMSNVLVINEVDPFSRAHIPAGKAPFRPTDIVALLRQADASWTSDRLLGDWFLCNLEFLRRECWLTGRTPVLRAHSHGRVLTGDAVRSEVPLTHFVANRFPVRALITVRDPVDSWLSMARHGWHREFTPSTFDEYSRRYLLFLKSYGGVKIIKYEDFVADPKSEMQRICKILDLDYYEKFEEVFGGFMFSGDSGRFGNSIEQRPRRVVPKDFYRITEACASYKELVSLLGYLPLSSG